jgi:ergothioneine biosynthesis protein EgtB
MDTLTEDGRVNLGNGNTDHVPKFPKKIEITASASDLKRRYQEVRALSEHLCETLETEDYVIQSMPEASPAKWHLAHTTWFFETFLLQPNIPNYQSAHPQYNYLFNSYYNAVGPFHCRPKRGLLSRPTVRELYDYRRSVDALMLDLLDHADARKLDTLEPRTTLGLNHEQQHQELMLTDLKHVFSQNPLRPTYRKRGITEVRSIPPIRWFQFEEGIHTIGHNDPSFSYDNEGPFHRVLTNSFLLSSRLVTNEEYLTFMLDGGYQRPELWLSLGWNMVKEKLWQAPLYWEEHAGGGWQTMTLAGMRDLCLEEPVCHVSFFEADAFARWSGARLPSEQEWELATLGVILLIAKSFIRRPWIQNHWVQRKCSGMSGNGRAARIRHIRATHRYRERLANTTGSSCVISLFSGEAPALHLNRTFDPRIGIFFHPKLVGSLRAFDSRRM